MTRRVTFEQYPDECETVGSGTALIFSGYINNASPQMTSLDIGFNHSWRSVQYLNERRGGLRGSLTNGSEEYSLYIGFWGYFTLHPAKSERHISFTYRAIFEDGIEEVGFICKTTLPRSERAREPVAFKNSHRKCSMITICLPTYQPNIDLLEIQLNSLVDQTHQNWKCIVCDDASDDHVFSRMQMLCAKDKRFQIFQHASNVGFYKNFERALGYVTADADYVALCDQDDYWYPEKLTRLTNAFTQDTTLVYSDMRLVDRQGATISNTYWTGRKNNYTNLRVLMAANTITGAACVFGKNLLDAILPFPHRVSDAYHDHWIAMVAFMAGSIRYIPEPLYDYRQHEGNVIGHTSFNRSSNTRSVARTTIRRIIRKFHEIRTHAMSSSNSASPVRSPIFLSNTRFGQLCTWLTRQHLMVSLMLKAPISPTVNSFNRYRVFFLDVFMNQYRGLQLFSTVIRLRTGTLHSSHKASALASYDDSKHTWIRLLYYHLLDKATGHKTGNRDLYMALGSLTYHFDWFGWLCRRQVRIESRKSTNEKTIRK